jgi:glutamyl-tRNA synthetase
MAGPVRVRFAPSPTGLLHLGGARTALFNWLFARHHGGEALLRIEDTDRDRSTQAFEASLHEDLAWLGLGFDGDPCRQSERSHLYQEAAERLFERGSTRWTEDDAGRRALYFVPPERSGTFRDELRGTVHFGDVEDFVILKSDGTPSYNFAAAVDDAAMGVTHVIRGEEHLSNTGRQTLLYDALGQAAPKFIHLGLILGPDGKKLSKRHGGAETIQEYRREGFLPDALLNYLALLGWTHPEGREEFADLEEIAREWDPTRLGASPATFDVERLVHENARRIRALGTEELMPLVRPFLAEPLPEGREGLAVEAISQDMRKLSEGPRLLREITGPVDPSSFVGRLPEASGEVFAHAARELEGKTLANLEVARAYVGELRTWARERGIRTRDLLHPLRLALTGRDGGPEMAYVFALLGAEEARGRIVRAGEARLGS